MQNNIMFRAVSISTHSPHSLALCLSLPLSPCFSQAHSASVLLRKHTRHPTGLYCTRSPFTKRQNLSDAKGYHWFEVRRSTVCLCSVPFDCDDVNIELLPIVNFFFLSLSVYEFIFCIFKNDDAL